MPAADTLDAEPVADVGTVGDRLARALDHMLEFEPLLDDPRGRRALSEMDPLIFALIYLPHHLRSPDTDHHITLSEFHEDIIDKALQWTVPGTEPAQHRDVYVAPRGCGKTTWFFLILPMWAAAHRHLRFIVAFSDAATQAETHLATFKHELETNAALRVDFPDLCKPARRQSGAPEADNQAMFISASRFVFAARGIDTKSLGLKVDDRRPDMIIMDDIEPPEENYSPTLKDKRLGAIVDSVLPLSVYARVVIVGTVTMAGSVIHDAVKVITQPNDEDPAAWVRDENFRVHYYPAILVDEEAGTERSIWPAKWSLAWLLSIAHTRSFLKNYQNDPMGADGAYWAPEDFRYGDVPDLTAMVLTIDPAVTTTSRSDYTALAVIGYSRVHGQAVVLGVWNRRVPPGAQLRALVLQILEQFPLIRGVIIESNQGGDTWKSILHDLPVKIKAIHQSEPKEVRAARALAHYQRGKVTHAQRFRHAEAQMVGFPKAPHDDIVDAIGAGLDLFLTAKRRPAASARSASYV
jgi:predicted phage terminase large subunit-like protein